MTQTSHELANFFVEASKALEERPQIIAKLAETEESLAICRDTNYGKDEQISHLRADMDNLHAELIKAKAEKETAEYAALEAKEQAEKLIASIRDVMRGAAAVDAILNPTPEPSKPTAETSGEPAVSSALASEPSSEPLAGSSPSSGEAVSSEITAVDRPLADVSKNIPAESVASNSVGSTTNVSSDPTTKPYATLEYWRKPDALSWKSWINGGGEKAPWINDSDFEHADIF